MELGPILRRELVVTSRRRSTYFDRVGGALFLLGVGCARVMLWDYLGQDRSSLDGMKQLILSIFGDMVGLLGLITMAMVLAAVAPGVARERDRKTLDALLATELSSAEIVIGTMAAGLVRAMSGLAVGLSLAFLMIPFAGIDPRLVLLAFAGLAATAFATAAVSIAASVGSKNAREALGSTVAVVWAFWMSGPLMVALVLPRLWPALAGWTTPVAVALIHSSPIAIVTNLLGLFRGGNLVETVVWMIGCELLGGALLTAWAIWRLRPASRAFYDVEGRSVLRKLRRTRWRSRPPCGDDPIFWNEQYGSRGIRKWQWLLALAINLGLLLGLARVVYHFAKPALLEVIAYGYTAAPGENVSLEFNPFARALITVVPTGPKLTPLPSGLARFEFNIVLRMSTLLFYMIHVLVATGMVMESLLHERERDTWLALLATPLTGREILRAKMLGALWRLRLPLIGMVGLWLLGVLAGAVHPLGFLASIVGLAISTGFLLAMGTSFTLWSRDRDQATARVIVPAMVMAFSGFLIVMLPTSVVSVWMGVGSMPVIGGLSLLSYEDVRAASRDGSFPYLAQLGLNSGEGAGTVALVCLLSLTVQAIAAWLLTRAAYRSFDAVVGRPVKPRTHC